MEMECLPRFGYGAEAASWSGGELGEAVAPRQRRHRAAADQRHGADARRTAPPAARCSLREDETGFCAVTWGDGDLGGPRSAPEALERLDSTEEFWRDWLRDGDFPDHPWRIHLQRSALVLKGLTYTPDRRDRRRPDHLAARDPRRRTQLGLPLQLDPRLDLQPLGAAHARLRPGGARLHALHRRRLPGRPGPADHVRDRRRAGPDREHARPPRRLRRRQPGADRQRRLRPAPERRLGRPARLDLPARKGAARQRHAGRPRS